MASETFKRAGFPSPLAWALAALAILAALAVFSPSLSRAAERDEALAASGIQFPEGFDRNTIGEVRGKVAALSRPESGPVRFRLDSEYDSYTVLAAPAWFWKELSVSVKNGDRVVVKGSKTVGRDANLYIVAQWVKEPAENTTFRFRDKTGKPLWTERLREEGARRDSPGDSRNSLDGSGNGKSLLDVIRRGFGK